MSAAQCVRIGGASGFWGDSCWGPEHLVRHGAIDFLVFDHLAELTMSVLAAARARNPELGYATDFVDINLRELLPDILHRGIRVIANAGGVNPQACGRAVEALAQSLGLQVRVAVVTGDDVLEQVDSLRARGVRDLDRDELLPPGIATANAYLGALPIRAALDQGAQIVITGRCVDSAVTLGALMHAFGWTPQDHDRLAQGSLAGHIIECGAQGSGGLFTDWEQVPDWAHIGYPIVECRQDGSFAVTKVPGTGGLITPATIAEQIVYEVHDPARYLLPDVVCDFSTVRLQAGPDGTVRVTGARGHAPTPHYKVSATWVDGWRCSGQLTIIGIDAVRKARRTGEALLERMDGLLRARGMAPLTRQRIEVLGEEAAFGPPATHPTAREAVLRLTAHHPRREALQLFSRELAAPGTSFAPGTTGAAGRPGVSPLVRHVAFLVPRSLLSPRVLFEGQTTDIPVPAGVPLEAPVPPSTPPDGPPSEGATVDVPLIALAHARSGDKGDISNIGVIARRPEWLPELRRALTTQRVAAHLGRLVRGPVQCHEWPGLDALNFVCHQALDGGGMASLRHDALGKAMAQILLTMTVPVSPATAAACASTQ